MKNINKWMISTISVSIALVIAIIMLPVLYFIGKSNGNVDNINVTETISLNEDGIEWIEVPKVKYDAFTNDNTTGALNQIKGRANDDARTTVFAIERDGAMIGVQTILTALAELNINPNKEMVIYLTPKEDAAVLTYNWETFDKYENVTVIENLGDGVEDSINDDDFENILSGVTNSKVDLYVDNISSFMYTENSVEELKESWKYVETLTFMTDGQSPNDSKTTGYGPDVNFFKENNYDYYDVISAEKTMDHLRNEEYSKVGKDEMQVASDLIQTTFDWDGDGVQDVYNYMIDDSYLFYGNGGFNYRNEDGVDFYTLTSDYTEETKGNLYEIYGLDHVDMSFSTGNENYVYSGNLLNSANVDENKPKDKAKIIEMYNQYVKGNSNVNIIYKSHPRSEQEYIDGMISEIESEVGETGWLYSVDHTIPLEIYLLTGIFANDEETSTSFYQIVNSTSTMLGAFISARQTEQILEISNSDQAQYDLVMNYWGELNPLLNWDLMTIV